MATFFCGKLDINPKKIGKFTGNNVIMAAKNQRINCHFALRVFIVK